MLALLGLVAVAGYQHRDKISEMLSGAGGTPAPTGQGHPPEWRGAIEGAREANRDEGPLGFLTTGLREVVDKFRQSGRGAVADSWVSHGPNQAITSEELKATIGPENLTLLSQRTGLSQDELLDRLSRNLPTAVDRYTPEGRIS